MSENKAILMFDCAVSYIQFELFAKLVLTAGRHSICPCWRLNMRYRMAIVHVTFTSSKLLLPVLPLRHSAVDSLTFKRQTNLGSAGVNQIKQVLKPNLL